MEGAARITVAREHAVVAWQPAQSAQFDKACAEPTPARSAYQRRGNPNAPDSGMTRGVSRTWSPSKLLDLGFIKVTKEGAFERLEENGLSIQGMNDAYFGGRDPNSTRTTRMA